MRLAVSGTHGVGKSTLIAQFLERFPGYAHEPEAFETLGDDVELTESGAPTPEALRALLDFTVATLRAASNGPDVIFERSPADYLAYAAASRGDWPAEEIRGFLREHTPAVRRAMQTLDVVAYLPVAAEITARSGEDLRFRRRVDRKLQGLLLDGDRGVVGADRAPRVVVLPAAPAERLLALERAALG